MNYLILVQLLLLGLRELVNATLLLNAFKGYLRLSKAKIIVLYCCVFMLETAFVLHRDAFFTAKELYMLGMLRIPIFLAITKLYPTRSLFMGFFLIYASILVYNVAYTLPALLGLGSWTQPAEMLLYSVGTVLAFFLCWRFFRRYQETITAPGNTKLLAITDVIILSYLSAIASQSGFARDFDLHHLISRIFIIVPAMLFMLIVLMLMEEINKNQQLNSGLNQLEALYNKEKNYHQQLLQHKEHEKNLQEKLAQNIATLEQLLEKQDYASLEQHFDRLLASSERLQRIVLSGNQVIDAVVAYWRMRCVEQNVTWQSEINIEEINVDDMDLAIVLGNALENAYTATIAPQVAKPCIKLKIITKSGFLLISLTNSFNGNLVYKDGAYFSAKRGFAKPGTGLANIRLLAERYHGYLKIDSTDEQFTLRLALGNRRQA